MNEEKFKLTLTPPMDAKGYTVKLDIRIEDSETLHLQHYPDFIWYLFGLIAIFGASFISLLLNSLLWVYCLILFAVLVYKVFRARAFICVMDKRTGIIQYHRSGVLMTTIDEQQREHAMSHIQRLEMYRYIKGGQWSLSWFGDDTFQIFLVLEKAQWIPLSPANLDFRECQEFTEQLRGFLGNEIPVKAVD